MLIVMVLSRLGSATALGSDDPWAAWRSPARIVSGRVHRVVSGEGSGGSIVIEISDETTAPATLTTVRYPKGFSHFFTPPEQGASVMVSVRMNPLDSSQLAVQAMFQSTSSRYGLAARNDVLLGQALSWNEGIGLVMQCLQPSVSVHGNLWPESGWTPESRRGCRRVPTRKTAEERHRPSRAVETGPNGTPTEQ